MDFCNCWPEHSAMHRKNAPLFQMPQQSLKQPWAQKWKLHLMSYRSLTVKQQICLLWLMSGTIQVIHSKILGFLFLVLDNCITNFLTNQCNYFIWTTCLNNVLCLQVFDSFYKFCMKFHIAQLCVHKIVLITKYSAVFFYKMCFANKQAINNAHFLNFSLL